MSPLPLVPPADGKNHLSWPDGTHDAAFSWDPSVRQEIDIPTTIRHFDGRQWPLAYFAEYGDEKWDVDFLIDTVTDGDQWTNLRNLIDGPYSRHALVWTDVFGNQVNVVCTVEPASRQFVLGGVPGNVSGRPLGGRFQRVRFSMTRIE